MLLVTPFCGYKIGSIQIDRTCSGWIQGDSYATPIVTARNEVGARFYLLPANEVCEGYVFTGVCLSTGGHAWLPGRACVVKGDMHGEGGVHGKRGAYVAKGGHGW